MGDGRVFLATNPNTKQLRINRANEYAAPVHNAGMTNVYSVSFPVCIV